jgi:hypothetical protein
MRFAFRRKALTRRNLPYLWWKYIGNSRRTFKARRAKTHFPGASQIAEQLMDDGIILGPSETFLTADGADALAEAAQSILALSRSDQVQGVIGRGCSDYKKSYLVPLVPWDFEHPLDSPLVRLALDPKLLEAISMYLGLWPRLHAIGAWLNFPTEVGQTNEHAVSSPLDVR